MVCPSKLATYSQPYILLKKAMEKFAAIKSFSYQYKALYVCYSLFVVAAAGQGCLIRIMGNPALKAAWGNISDWLALMRWAWSSEALSEWQLCRCNWALHLNVMFPQVRRARDWGCLSRGWWMVLDINICGRTESALLWYQCCPSGMQLDKLLL